MSATMRALKLGTRPGRGMPGTGFSGDPGLFSILGKGIKAVAGVAKNIPGPVGFVAGAASNVFRAKPQAKPPSPLVRNLISRSMPFAPQERTPVQQPVPGFRGFVERTLPGGRTGMMAGGPPGSGFHLNKSSYFLKDGTFIEKGTVWVRNRRRNPLNPRALDRAIGRVGSAKRAASKLGRITIRKVCPS